MGPQSSRVGREREMETGREGEGGRREGEGGEGGRGRETGREREGGREGGRESEIVARFISACHFRSDVCSIQIDPKL